MFGYLESNDFYVFWTSILFTFLQEFYHILGKMDYICHIGSTI